MKSIWVSADVISKTGNYFFLQQLLVMEFIQIGETLGLKGEELRKFVETKEKK